MKKENQAETPMLTIADFAARIGVSKQTVWRWISEDRVPGAKQIGQKVWLIPQDSQVMRPTMGRPMKGV